MTRLSSTDARRRRILFRAQHRGTREMDFLIGRFAAATIGELSEAELDDFERLIEVPDPDVLNWLTGKEPTPGNYDTLVFRKLKAFHTHARPIYR
jgi:antitoxin CptB